MAATAKTSVVVHTGEGPVWITAGAVVPENLLHLLNEDLLEQIPEPPAPAPPPQSPSSTGEDDEDAEEPADTEDAAPADEPVEPVDGESGSEGEEPPEEVAVPYASYPLAKWVEYARSIKVDPTGLNKTALIHAIAQSQGITTEGLRPADVVDGIRQNAAQSV